MNQDYFLSLNGGKTSKGPFPIDEIQNMYLNNRVPENASITINKDSSWTLISELYPDLARARSSYHTEINAAIEHSEKVAIAEEKNGIWGGLVMLILGTVVTVFTYKYAADSPSGGTYVIAYGPILTGFMAFMVGLVSTIQRKKAKKKQQSQSISANA